MSNEATQNFSQKLGEAARIIEAELSNTLSDKLNGDEIARPAHLMAAMRHGSLNGGKRLRPFLVLETAKLFDGNAVSALKTAVALELIHCYSLVHDDLPAMDDDDLRRGQPTVHIAFDEATAILAGDGLLTLAFDMISAESNPLEAEFKLKLIQKLSKAAGLGGMVGGQALDLAAEDKDLKEADIITLQQMKTGALIRYACEAGAIVGKAGEQDILQMRKFGQLIGQAFQLADDLLDITSSAEKMGKQTGKDADRGKATLVDLHGIEWAKARLQTLADEAVELLNSVDGDTSTLRETALFIVNRDR